MRRLLFALLLLIATTSIASSAQQTQSLSVTLTWTQNPLKNEQGVRIWQCVGQGCTPDAVISGDLPPGTTSYLDRIDNDPGNRVICYQGEYFNSAGNAKGPIGCITTPPVVQPPQAPGAFSFDVKVVTVVGGVTQLPGSTNGWTDGTYAWFGPASCNQGWLLSSTSTAIDAGAFIPGFHCPHPGPSLDGCVEWSGKAPDIGACEYISG